MRRFVVWLLGAVTLVGTAQAQTKVGSRPDAGAEVTATVGSPVIERFRVTTTRVATADVDALKGTLTGNITIRAGDPLTQVSSKAKFKACSASGPCGLDDDGDGTFDRIALDDVVRALKLKEPVHYTMREIEVPNPAGNFRQIVTFLGVSAGTLRLSYREFLNDMARPAFTEELTFPLAAAYPQPLAFKDTRLTILGIDGAGMRYRVEK